MKTDETVMLTGQQLEEFANKYVPDSIFNKAIKEHYFREFIRTILLFQYSAIELPGNDQSFGHELTGKNEKGEMVTVTYQVQVTSKIVVKQ